MKNSQEEQVTLSHFNKTIGDLADMVKKGFDSVDKRFEKSDKRFDRVEDRLGSLEDGQVGMTHRLSSLEDGQERIERRINNAVSYHQHEKLEHRVGTLERKTGLSK